MKANQTLNIVNVEVDDGSSAKYDYADGDALASGASSTVLEQRGKVPMLNMMKVHSNLKPLTKMNITYAVKMIDRVEADSSEIEREIRVLVMLNHPNIVKCLDIFIEKCFVCIVMDK